MFATAACPDAPLRPASLAQTYLLMHKQRHHVITEVVEPYYAKQIAVKKATGNTAFLDGFLGSAYPALPARNVAP
jgi:NADH dehydrogenase (ubiquinone) 1 alpha subcomplex subunit 6